MPVTITHAKSLTIGDSTNTALVRPSDWNSGHQATFSLDATEAVKWFQNGTNSISSGTLSFGTSNNISLGLDGNTLTASYFDNDSVRNVVFSGFDDPMVPSMTGYISANTSTSRPWIAMPVSLNVSQTFSGFRFMAGFSGSSATVARTNRATMSMGIYSINGASLSTIWSSSFYFSHLASSSSQTISFGDSNGLYSLTTVSAAFTRDFNLSIPVTLTLQSGTYYFGVMDQLSQVVCSLRHGVLTDPANATAGLVLGSTNTGLLMNPNGCISATAGQTLPGTLSNHVTVLSASKYPVATLV